MSKNFYCTICGKLQDKADIEYKEIKRDSRDINVTIVRLNCCSKSQTIRIYSGISINVA